MMSATVKDVTSIINVFPWHLKKINEIGEDESHKHYLKFSGAALPIYARCYGDCNFCMTVRNSLIY